MLAALSSCDPGDILATIRAAKQHRVRVSGARGRPLFSCAAFVGACAVFARSAAARSRPRCCGVRGVRWAPPRV